MFGPVMAEDNQLAARSHDAAAHAADNPPWDRGEGDEDGMFSLIQNLLLGAADGEETTGAAPPPPPTASDNDAKAFTISDFLGDALMPHNPIGRGAIAASSGAVLVSSPHLRPTPSAGQLALATSAPSMRGSESSTVEEPFGPSPSLGTPADAYVFAGPVHTAEFRTNMQAWAQYFAINSERLSRVHNRMAAFVERIESGDETLTEADISAQESDAETSTNLAQELVAQEKVAVYEFGRNLVNAHLMHRDVFFNTYTHPNPEVFTYALCVEQTMKIRANPRPVNHDTSLMCATCSFEPAAVMLSPKNDAGHIAHDACGLGEATRCVCPNGVIVASCVQCWTNDAGAKLTRRAQRSALMGDSPSCSISCMVCGGYACAFRAVAVDVTAEVCSPQPQPLPRHTPVSTTSRPIVTSDGIAVPTHSPPPPDAPPPDDAGDEAFEQSRRVVRCDTCNAFARAILPALFSDPRFYALMRREIRRQVRDPVPRQKRTNAPKSATAAKDTTTGGVTKARPKRAPVRKRAPKERACTMCGKAGHYASCCPNIAQFDDIDGQDDF